jgi:hypothetical protein
LRRQHNMLCFILDTPHRGRYFHDCVIQSFRVESNQQVRLANHLQSISAEPSRSPSRQRTRLTPY